MLLVNRWLIRGILLATLAGVLIIVSIICLPIVRNNSIDSETFQSDTLFYTGKDASDSSIMYLLMEYQVLKKDSIYVKRSIATKKDTDNCYHYYMIQKSDSLVLLKPVHEEEWFEDSVYIDLRTDRISSIDYSLNRLSSNLQFVGYERYKDLNGKQDSLVVMYGCDISENGCFEERNKHHWYFDRNFHLRKVATTNGIIFFIDKHYFGIE